MTLTSKRLYNWYPNDSQHSDAPHPLKASTRGEKTESRWTAALEAVLTEAENRFSKVYVRFFFLVLCVSSPAENFSHRIWHQTSPSERSDLQAVTTRAKPSSDGDTRMRFSVPSKNTCLDLSQVRNSDCLTKQKMKTEDIQMRHQRAWQENVPYPN